ncbi:MAG: VCBS repeat-containing protein, partial [Bacteroidota bacterium]
MSRADTVLAHCSVVRRTTGRACVIVFCLLLAACSVPDQTGGDADPTAAWSFADVTAEAGLGDFRHETGAVGQRWFPETMGGGGGFVDYDGDGWDDIVLVQGRTWDEGDTRPALRLFRNQQDGTFADVTTAMGLDAASAYGMGLAAGDLDGDGDVDLILTAVGANQLWRNDGNRFTEVGQAAGIVSSADSWSTAAQLFDADRDGDLDLFIGKYVDWTPETDIACTFDGTEKSYCTPEIYTAEPSRFYRNRGDGTFEDATEAAGFGGNPGKTLGATTWDVNGDGWTDLFVANDREPDQLYLNDGTGAFQDVGVA